MKNIKFFFILFIGVLAHWIGHSLMVGAKIDQAKFNGEVINIGYSPYEFDSFGTTAWIFFILYYCLLFSLAKHLSEEKW